VKQERSSFLTKRTKKLSFDCDVFTPQSESSKSFFATFFSKKVVLACLLLFPFLASAQTVLRDGVTLTQAQETRAEGIGDQLRCLVCQNESIEASGASLAHQLRVIIRQHVIAGETDKQIMDFMVQRYGIFVLLKPPLSPLTLLLYAMPFLALAFGALTFWLTRRTRIPPPPPLDEGERKRLKSLLET
jgi:cytochrome c-type biogenesis protein CcmH